MVSISKKDCVFFQFAKANQRANRFLTQKAWKLNLTAVQAMVLSFLDEQDRITSSELGKRIELDSATITGILDRLEAAGFIERRANPNNRRSVHIHLTKQGKVISKKAVAVIAEANQEFTEDISAKERRDLLAIIAKLHMQAKR